MWRKNDKYQVCIKCAANTCITMGPGSKNQEGNIFAIRADNQHQDVENCAKVGVGWGALLNSPSSLHGVSLTDSESFMHHSCFTRTQWQSVKCRFNSIIHSMIPFPRQLDLPAWISQFATAQGECSVLWFLEGRRWKGGCVTTIIRMSGNTHQRLSSIHHSSEIKLHQLGSTIWGNTGVWARWCELTKTTIHRNIKT